MTIGEKIKKYRIFKGLTQAELGKMVGLSGDRIRQYENDVRTPKDDKLYEIADALGVNAAAISEPTLNDENGIMHILFELEENYGLRIDSTDSTYTLSFVQSDTACDSALLKNGLNNWIRKRNELQPDINDSAGTIKQKKDEYTLWKARYPYSMEEQINKVQQELLNFNASHKYLLPPEPVSVKTFSDFFGYFIALINTGLSISIDDKMPDTDNIRIKIEQKELFSSNDDILSVYICFEYVCQQMNKLGLECQSFPVRNENNDSLYICFCFASNQITTLLSRYKTIKNKFDSEIIDESTYEAEIKELKKIYNVRIEDYV